MQIVSLSHATHLPEVRSGAVYFGSVPLAGFTATAAAPATPMAALWNPAGNSKNLSVQYIDVWVVSGTAAGVLGYYQLATTATPPGGNIASVNAFLGGPNTPASSAKFYSNTALGVTPTFFKSSVSFGVAAPSNFPNVTRDLVDGTIVLAPGSVLSITTSATGTSFVVGASICWEETVFPTL